MSTTRPDEYGVPIQEDVYKDLADMVISMAVCFYADEQSCSLVLGEPFSYSIPKLGLKSSDDVKMHLAQFWMPELFKLMRWVRLFGICPICWKQVGDNLVPMVPDFCQGLPWVKEDEKTHEKRFYWFWNNTETTKMREPERNILWVRTRHEPDADGKIRSPARTLLDEFRTLRHMRRAHDRVIQRRAFPLHLLQHEPRSITAQNDNLSHYNAPFGNVAGVAQARRDQKRAEQTNTTLQNVFRRMMWQKEKFQGDSMPLFYTDMPDEMVWQMKSGFPEHCIPITEGYKYVQPAKEEAIGDYFKAEESFNKKAAAVFDFAPELIFPSGSSHTQSFQGAQQFQMDRTKQLVSFLLPVIRNMLIYAYREGIAEFFDAANKQLGDGSDEVMEMNLLYPELDIEVTLTSKTLVDPDEVRGYVYDGIVDKQDYQDYVYSVKNLPMEKKRIHDWPDHIPKELFVKEKNTPQGSLMSGKPPKKKNKPAGK